LDTYLIYYKDEKVWKEEGPPFPQNYYEYSFVIRLNIQERK